MSCERHFHHRDNFTHFPAQVRRFRPFVSRIPAVRPHFSALPGNLNPPRISTRCETSLPPFVPIAFDIPTRPASRDDNTIMGGIVLYVGIAVASAYVVLSSLGLAALVNAAGRKAD